MGICASKRQMLVVRQSSALKLPLQQQAMGLKTATNGLLKLNKQESGLNLLPNEEAQKNWKIVSDESIFERERRMVVLLVSCQPDRHSQLVLIDVDFQSANFGKVICRLSLPLPGEELYSLACMRNTHSGVHQEELDHLLEQHQKSQQFTLIAPVPSHSRIYVLNLMDGTMGVNGNGETGSLKAQQQQQQQVAEGGVLTQIRIQKCITREELSRWDLGAPLSVCSNNAGRSSALPLLLVTAVDRSGHCKGDLLRLDRRSFCPVDRRKRSITEEDRETSFNSGHSSFSGSPQASLKNGQIPVPPLPGQLTKFPLFGGTLAISLRHGVVFTTEWGNLERIFQERPSLRQDMGSTDFLNGEGPSQIYGCSVNVWEMRRRRLVQNIRLDPEDGLWPVCIRMLHQTELSHGFVCTALGSAVFHLHKSTKSGAWMADRVAKFSKVSVGSSDWPGACPEMPPLLTDMAISMDDQYLYVCAAFHGFVAQMNISDPFRPSLTQKVFLGGIVYRCMGVAGLGKMPLDKTSSAQKSYNTEKVKLDGRLFEGGPCRLQISLDGRRLFISNSFLRNWDAHFFPQLAEHGSSIALVHVDPTGNKPMKLDEEFGIHFEREPAEGGTKAAAALGGQHSPTAPFYAREMRFLGGDSTSDYI